MGIPCTINPAAPSVFTFLATVRIPLGYIITEPPIYNLHLTLDSNNLRKELSIELKNSTIYLDDSDPSKVLNCFSKVYKVELHGPVYYNVVIERFQTAQNLDPSKYTAFSSADAININTDLGYSCYECDFPSDIQTHFTTSITQGTEFVITSDGSIIPHNPLDPDPFFAALKDPNSSQTIQIPYTLTITPLP